MKPRHSRITLSERITSDDILSAQDGNPEAHNRLMLALEPVARGSILRLIGRQTEDIDDLVQEALLKVFLNLRRFPAERAERLPGWVSSVARNRCLDLLRSRSFKPDPIADVHSMKAWLASANAMPFEEVLEGDARHRLSKAMQELPAPQRDAFERHCLEGQTYADIAVRTNTHMVTVKTRVLRARTALRSMFPDAPCPRRGAASHAM